MAFNVQVHVEVLRSDGAIQHWSWTPRPVVSDTCSGNQTFTCTRGCCSCV